MQQIDNIEIKNFKSIRHQKIDGCKRVNVFIGYPNVGKSNILEALGLFSFLKLGDESFGLNDICRYNNPRELFFNQDSKNNIEVLLNSNINVELWLSKNNQIDFRINKLVDNVGNKDNLQLTNITIDRLGNPGSYSTIPESNYNKVIGNIKKYEFKKNISFNAQKSQSLSIPFGDNLLDILQGSPILRKDIVEIFSQYQLKLIIDRTDESIKFQKELEDGSVVSIPYHQVADTLRRLVFFKACIETNLNSILLFEEPEAHMFPPYIAKFTSDIIFDKNNNQYFIATHSPFVLNDFMEEMEKNDLSIYVVGLEQGETVIRHLTDEQVTEVYKYGVDLFFNLEDYLKNAVS